jgi:S1-C subfamily serine protease
MDQNVSPSIVINQEDLAYATSPRMASPVARLHSPTMPGEKAPSLPNSFRQPITPFSVISFMVSLLGVPIVVIILFGGLGASFFPIHIAAIIVGIVSILFGAIAIGHIQVKRRRGTLFAVCGVFIGLGCMVGWILATVVISDIGSGSPRRADIHFSASAPDLASIAAMPEPIQRAMRANVVVMASSGWGMDQALGSGVIVKVDSATSKAYILTNRHVIDPDFRGSFSGDAIPKNANIQVEMLGQSPRKATIHWIAPHGVDAALISTDILTDEAVATKWKKGIKPQIGSDIFGVGNPQELTWTQTKGSVSQIRKQKSQGHEFSLIQTDVPISCGNSGGGLYDQQGYLLGINTWTMDKRVAEGLSFAISLDSILELQPPFLVSEEKSP